jgi:threonine synthase
MQYTTTRGCGRSSTPSWYTFADVVTLGVPADPSDGLFVPARVPQFTPEQLSRLSELSFPELASEVMRLFLDADDDYSTIVKLIRACFEEQPAPSFQTLGPNAVLMELFHGPSLSFKDVAVRPAVALLAHFMRRRGIKHASIVVATSGDTGPSVLHAVKGRSDMKAFVLFPQGLVARQQALQMTRVRDVSACVFQVAGATSDSLDAVVARVFADAALRPQLCTLNSLNWARICAQIPHFFWAHFRAGAEFVVVPTG